jgi:acyl-CoA synthetase (AMP-forming)/AMP-acid ligase II
MAEPETLVALLERAAEAPAAGLRFIDRRENDSFHPWSEIRSRAQAVAGSLAASGVGQGDRVVLVYPTGIEFFDAFFGALLAGAVPVPLYPPVRLGRLDEYHQRTAAMVGGVAARVVLAERRVRRLLGPAVEMARPPLGCRTLESLPVGRGAVAAVAADDLAMVQYSSGTTVDPKPVALTHRAVLAQTVRLNGFWPDGNGVRHSGASWLPLYHDMGLIGCVFPALERPAVLTLIPPELFVARPAVWLRTISRFGATVSPAPNFAYGLCVDKIADDELDGVDLSSWRVALNGAEPVAARVLRAFQERFQAWGFRPQALTPVYGLSEAALAVTFSDIDRTRRTGSRGRRARLGRAAATGLRGQDRR